jgi:hypothetical protein
MNAITILQPHASAIAAGLKKIETRGWPAPEWVIGKRIAIHASSAWTRDVTAFWTDWLQTAPADELAAMDKLGITYLVTIPREKIVATAMVAASTRTEDLLIAGKVSEREKHWGNYTPGRFGWELRDVRPLKEPIHAMGLQKLWNWEPPAGIE